MAVLTDSRWSRRVSAAVRCSSQGSSIAVDYGACRLMTSTRPVSIIPPPPFFLLPFSVRAGAAQSAAWLRDTDEWSSVQTALLDYPT